MFEIILNVLLWIGLLMAFCVICSLLGILIISVKIAKGDKSDIWITPLKKKSRDFIEKGI